MKLDKKQQKWLLIALVVVIVAVVIYYYIQNKKKKAALAAASSSSSSNGANQLVANESKMFASCPNDAFPLKQGSCGKKVEQLQLWMLKKYGAKLNYGTDGLWGEETNAAFKKFVSSSNPVVTEDFYNQNQMSSFTTNRFK